MEFLDRRSFNKLVLSAAGGIVAGSLAGCHKTGDSSESARDLHVCKGHNDCKGQGGCKTADHDCAGKNDCKGQGGCASMTARHDCAGKNDCKGLGGCKSGDNGCAGKNTCKGKGGCKVPVTMQ